MGKVNRRNVRLLAVVLIAIQLLVGCGGSNRNPTVTPTFVERPFVATLADGSRAFFDIDMVMADGRLNGEYEVDTSDESPIENLVGVCSGTIAGNQVNFSCVTLGGNRFTLAGTQAADGSLSLVHSGIGGAPAHYSPLEVTPDELFLTRSTKHVNMTLEGKTQVLSWSTPYARDGNYLSFHARYGAQNLPAKIIEDSRCTSIWVFSDLVDPTIWVASFRRTPGFTFGKEQRSDYQVRTKDSEVWPIDPVITTP